jgi:ankyrin repeat protein
MHRKAKPSGSTVTKGFFVLVGVACALVGVSNVSLAQDRQTQLNAAVRAGDIGRVRQMLDDGAEVNAKDQEQDTPLHVAAYCGRVRIAALLIQRGADINAQNRYQETPLHYAASQGKADVVALLVQQGADVNARNRYQETPLHWAASEGRAAVAELLIQSGADVDARDNSQMTPLHWATSQGKKDVATLLIEKGTGVNVSNHRRATPRSRVAEKKTATEKKVEESTTELASMKPRQQTQKKQAIMAQGCADIGRDKMNSGDYAGAIKLYSQAIVINPGDSLCHRWLGDTYDNFGDRKQAIREWKEAARLGDRIIKSYLDHMHIE